MAQSGDSPGQASLGDFEEQQPTDLSHTPSMNPSHNSRSSSSPRQAALDANWSSQNTQSPSRQRQGGTEDSPSNISQKYVQSDASWFEPTSESPDAIFDKIRSKFESQPIYEFERPEFNGCGVYGLYYHGDLDLYQEISNPPKTQEIPIYIGKAGPKGGRTGCFDLDYDVPKLAERISEHYDSIQDAENLRTSDFTYTYLKLKKPYIRFAEEALISAYRPWWNTYISGLGNHDVGSNRAGSEQSLWDTFHPGRHFVKKRSLVPRGTQEGVWREEIAPELADDDLYNTTMFPGCSGPDPFDPQEGVQRSGTAGLEDFLK